jgi:hypothetical protein
MVPHVVDGRNKLFFFFAYEGQRQNANSQAGKITTFTPLEAQGNFSQSVNGGPDPAVASFLLANPYFSPAPRWPASHHRSHPHQPVALNYFKNGLLPTARPVMCFPRQRQPATIPSTWASSITTSARAIR